MFVDDGSVDSTWEIITHLCKTNEFFEGVSLSRNQGHQSALYAGIMEAKDKSDIIITADCDGQDDINAVEKMLDGYFSGSDIVYGVRKSRKTNSFAKKSSAGLFYRFLKLMGAETVYDHADYRLITSEVANVLSEFKEVNLYLRGIIPLHDFESKWYTWPLMLKPVWYFGSKELAHMGHCSTIAVMGNPVVWWIGSLCMILFIVKRIKNSNERFVITGFLSQYLPWIFISRYTFIYHFFASVPFIILALVFFLKGISDRLKKGWITALTIVVTAEVLFFMFYPVISGCVASRGYVLEILKWFDSWILCY